MHRYYCLTVERNLFGEWSLIRSWGRTGRPSRMTSELHATQQDARTALSRKEREKRRRGYR
jgi:predicted DNA-binding WGR domain protein